MTVPRQSQLLESARHLDWLPDETLYSLASRHHRLSGNLRPDHTAQQLFGHCRGGSPHDLPAGLDYFAAVLGGRLGSGESVALERTMVAGLVAFRSEPDRRNAVEAMRSPRIGGLKSRLGLPASQFGATCLLKACVTCMRVDAVNHGTAYWRRAHQLPGASLCLDHQEILRISSSDRAKQSRFDWRLPVLPDLIEVFDHREPPSDTQLQLMRRLTQLAADAATTAREPAKDGARLANALWAGMVTRDWITPSGRLNRKVATAQWRCLVLQLAALPEWCELGTSESAAYSQILSLLSDPTRGHVLRPLTLVACLFDTWKDYWAEVVNLPPRTEAEQPTQAGDATMTLQSQLITIAGAAGSISAAAKTLGVAVASAQAWVAAAGRSPPKRPSKLRDEVLWTVLEKLRQGHDLSHIAKLTGISESSIRRVLRTTVGIRGQWLDARRMTRGALVRKHWSLALGLSVTAGSKAARALEPKAYAWLYRNDRAWLLATNEAAKCPLVGNHVSVDWDARDRALSDACQRAALKLYENADGGRITLVDVIRAVPELRTKLHRLENLPLTARFIRGLVTGGSEAGQLSIASL